MNKFLGSKTMRAVVSASMLAVLAACGGGGGGDGAGTNISVSGTAATGKALGPSAAVKLTCANGAVLTGSTDAAGRYTTLETTVLYPCIGTATLGAVTYRGLLAKGASANFTPLTDLMVEAMLAASAAGESSLTLAQFIAKIQAEPPFAAGIVSDSSLAGYRNAAIAVARAALIAAGSTPAEADAILLAASSVNYESTAFVVGSPLDRVLDNTASVLLDNGVVKSSVLASAKATGNTLPLPTNSATGATGGTGGSGSGT